MAAAYFLGYMAALFLGWVKKGRRQIFRLDKAAELTYHMLPILRTWKEMPHQILDKEIETIFFVTFEWSILPKLEFVGQFVFVKLFKNILFL